MNLKPLNLSAIGVGFVLIILNLAAIGPLATGAVPDAVKDAVATKVKDDICEDVLCLTVTDDWAESTSQRDFYAWSILNVDDVENNGSAPIYEQIGPITYDVTLKRAVEEYDIKNGLLTYSQITSYECSPDTLVACDTEVSQLNIAFNPQVVGATGTAINAVMDITKVGFVSGVIDIHFQQVSAAYGVAEEIREEHMAILTTVEGPGSIYIIDTLLHNTAESFFLDGVFSAFDEAYGDAFLDDPNATYLSSGGVEPQWISGTWNDDGDGEIEYDEEWRDPETGTLYGDEDGNGIIEGNETLEGDINGNGIEDNESSSFVSDIDLEHMFYHAVGPGGEDLAFINYMGPLVYAAMGEPNTLEEIENNPEDSITLQRAEIWGFAHPTDIEITLARDWTLYGGMGSLMIDYGAAADDYLTNESEDAVQLSTRMEALLGIEISNEAARAVLGLGDGTDEPLGIVAVSESGTSFGLDAYVSMSRDEAMSTYGITSSQHDAIKGFALGWLTNQEALPLILVGGEGTITASEFVNQSFGAINPIDDTYMEYSLNAGGMWGSGILGFPSAPAVNLSQAQSANMLYGPYGLTTTNGASMFLYGELSGKTLPINYTTGESAPAQEWNDEAVAAIYGIDVNAAAAARLLMMEVVFSNFVPEFLIDSFGTSKYLTQPVNNWLLGWHDPVNAYLATGDSSDMTAGWTSLESNETYFGSAAYVEGGISTGDPAIITMCTGEAEGCDKGETVKVGDSDYISWRTVEKEIATFGLITAELQGETVGPFITGEGDLVDLSGYGIVDLNCDSKGELKEVPVDICKAKMDPLDRPIQAKLINNGDLLDAIPGALPVYFGSDVTIKAEQISKVIIGGESESIFYLDTRPTTEQQDAPTMDNLQEVFMIKTSGELDDETADALVSNIVVNQDPVMYFSNFDHWIDWVTLVFWIMGIAGITLGAFLAFKPESEFDGINLADEMSATDSIESSGDTTVNITNISINDSVVIDSVIGSSDEEPPKDEE